MSAMKARVVLETLGRTPQRAGENHETGGIEQTEKHEGENHDFEGANEETRVCKPALDPTPPATASGNCQKSRYPTQPHRLG